MFALLYDTHANLEALDACLKHARQGGATRYAFLGDLVGYGADPQRVVEIVMRHAAEGAVVVKGNPDVAFETTEAGMSDGAAETRDWTRSALDAGAQKSVDAAGTPYTFCGHAHHQALYLEAAPGRMTKFRPVPGSAVPVPGRRWLAIVDLIVLGAPGPQEHTLAWWRSVASGVTANAHRSVYVVRVPEKAEPDGAAP